MKTAVFISFFASLCAATLHGALPTISGSSRYDFVVDTRSDTVVKDVTSSYCSGSYGGQGGRKATFLSGVHCEIEFKIEASSKEGNLITDYLVNGERRYNNTFRFDVGSLPVGGQLIVIVVDRYGNQSDPFRVNMEIAGPPPLWGVAGRLTANVVADMDPRGGRVTYRASEFRGFSVFDAVSDALEFAGEELPLDLTPTLKLYQTMESDNGQFLVGNDVGGGIGNYGRVKDKIGRFAGLNVSASLTGGQTYDYDPEHKVWRRRTNRLGVNLDGSWKWRQRIPQCPLIYGEVGFSASGSFIAREEDGVWYSDIGLEPLIALTATAGIGVDVVAEAEVSGQGGLNLTAKVPGGLERIYVNGKLMWRTVFLGFERSGVWWEADYDLYPKSAKLASVVPSPTVGWRVPRDGFVPIPRSYGDGKSHVVRLSSAQSRLLLGAVNEVQVLMQNGYPNPQPTLAVAGTKAALAYVRDNAARSDLNRTEIVFREEALDGSWGGETHVWNDGTADFQPKLALLPDGKAVAAWANAKRTFVDGTSFETICSSLEIAVGVRDAQSGVWTCSSLTDDAAFDGLPVLKGAANGSAAVAWVRNGSGAYLGSRENPSDLAVSFYRNGVWTSTAVAVAGAGTVISHDLAWDGDRAVLVWAVDADGDLSTDDAEVWAKSFANDSWSASVRLSAAAVGAMRPYVWFLADGTPHVTWVQGGKLFASSGLDATSGTAVATAVEASIPGDYRVAVHGDGSATFLWAVAPLSSKDSLEGEVLTAGYTADAGLAASASWLRQQSIFRNLSGAMAEDGTFRMAGEQVAVSTNGEGRIVRGGVDVVLGCRKAVSDVGVAVEDCSFASDLYVGGTNRILIGVQNHGTVAAPSFAYQVWAGEGSDKSLLASGDLEIAPLSRKVVEVPWTPDEGLTNVVFTIEADVNNSIGDSNRANNTLVWRPDVGRPEISFSRAKAVKATDHRWLISATLHNDAVAPLTAGTVVKFWRGEIGGELIGTDVAGIVSGGEAGEYDVGVAWDISGCTFTSAWERVVIEMPEELGGKSVDVWTTTPLYDPDDVGGGGGGGGNGGGNGGETPSAPPNIGRIVGFGGVDGNRNFTIYFHGETGFTYNVQYREKLEEGSWTTIMTVKPVSTGDFPVAVPIVSSAPSGFFRIVVGQ